MARYGVRIVADEDFDLRGFTDDDDLARETRDRLADGTWGVYGVQTIHECECGDVHPTGDSVWGVVVESTTLEGCDIFDPREINDDYLRQLAEEFIGEASAA